jgi:hypothetical protein
MRLIREGPVTFVYGSRDAKHNAAIALKEYLEAGESEKQAASGAAHGQYDRRRGSDADNA